MEGLAYNHCRAPPLQVLHFLSSTSDLTAARRGRVLACLIPLRTIVHVNTPSTSPWSPKVAMLVSCGTFLFNPTKIPALPLGPGYHDALFDEPSLIANARQPQGDHDLGSLEVAEPTKVRRSRTIGSTMSRCPGIGRFLMLNIPFTCSAASGHSVTGACAWCRTPLVSRFREQILSSAKLFAFGSLHPTELAPLIAVRELHIDRRFPDRVTAHVGQHIDKSAPSRSSQSSKRVRRPVVCHRQSASKVGLLPNWCCRPRTDMPTADARRPHCPCGSSLSGCRDGRPLCNASAVFEDAPGVSANCTEAASVHGLLAPNSLVPSVLALAALPPDFPLVSLCEHLHLSPLAHAPLAKSLQRIDAPFATLSSPLAHLDVEVSLKRVSASITAQPAALRSITQQSFPRSLGAGKSNFRSLMLPATVVNDCKTVYLVQHKQDVTS